MHTTPETLAKALNDLGTGTATVERSCVEYRHDGHIHYWAFGINGGFVQADLCNEDSECIATLSFEGSGPQQIATTFAIATRS
jgi:hypothetical protein